jgi:predicted RNA-binding protein YlqC (UPF0109 family)
MTKEIEAGVAMRELMRGMVVALVDSPEQVLVGVSVQERWVGVDVQVSPDDVGKVIGKQGRTARSLRTILGATAVKLGVAYELNIQEPPRAGKGGR